MIQPDIIGLIFKPTGETVTIDGIEQPEMKPIEGFHVNFPEEVEEISQYKLEPQPETPMRIYAGGIKPVCYRFPDKETFLQFFPEDITNQ